MNELQGFLGSVVTIHYKTLEGERDFQSGILTSVSESRGSTFFRLEYTNKEEQRATGIGFAVDAYTIEEGEVEYE
jgi:hypothetical protein